MSKSRVRLGPVFACTVILCTLALAADQKSPTKLSDLPPEARQAISSALARKSPAIQDFTLTASDGTDGDIFGSSVAIDGNTVVVGAPWANFNNHPGPGAAYVFVKPAKGWSNMTQTAELTASDRQNGDYFGGSVAISGNTIVVSASEATVNGNPEQGAAYVFVKPAGGWTNMTETAKLTASDGTDYSVLGVSVSISGNTVVAGAPQSLGNNPGSGSAYIFVEPSGGWADMTQTAELTPSDGTLYDDFGFSVSVSGETVIVGGGQCGGGCPGTAYIFAEPPNGWSDMTETAQLTPADHGVDAFGISVSINGPTAVVGGSNSGYEGAGAVYVFVEPAGGWSDMTQTAELTVNKTKFACLGSSVAISANVILAGADCTHLSTGVAYAFLKPAGGWQNSSKFALELSIPFTYQYDYFGASVAISGKVGVIGAPYAPTSPPCRNGNCASGPGEAFIFTEK
jgi:hypothetical protein